MRLDTLGRRDRLIQRAITAALLGMAASLVVVGLALYA